MFLQRAIVSLTLGPLGLFLIYKGEWFYFIPIVIIILIASYEYIQIISNINWQVPALILMPLILIQSLSAHLGRDEWGASAMVVGLLLMAAYALWQYERNNKKAAIIDLLAGFTGILFFGWLGRHFFSLRQLPDMAWQWTMLAMLSTWITDSGAYLVGKFLAGNLLGRHHITPNLSPKKTLEGYFGGIILGTAFTVLIASWLQLPLLLALVLGLLVSIITPVGDLMISLLKREAGVKDSGKLFPGHGGALDRIDTLIWSVAMANYLIRAFG